MMLIYSPTRLSESQEEKLDAALQRDGARVHYQGNDGSDDYVIVEAVDFAHTQRVGRDLGLPLALTRDAAASAPKRARRKKA